MPIIEDKKNVSQSISEQLCSYFYSKKEIKTASYANTYHTAEQKKCLAILTNDNLKREITYIYSYPKCLTGIIRYYNTYFFEDNKPKHLIKYLKNYNENLEIDISTYSESNYTNETDEFSHLIRFSITKDIPDCCIYILHKNIGWQQFNNQYLYRSIVDLINGTPLYHEHGNFHINRISTNNFDMQHEIDNMISSLTLIDHNFTISIFLYMLFSKCKSLFRQFNHNNIDIDKYGFCINVTINNENHKSLCAYLDYIVNNFNCIANKHSSYTDIFSSNITEKFSHKLNSILSKNYFQIKEAKIHLKDFSIPRYRIDLSDSVKLRTTQLVSEVNSKISFVYVNLENNNDFILNIPCHSFLSDYTISDYLENKSFNMIINDYIDFISEILSDEITKKEELRKENIIKNDNAIKMSEAIYAFIKEISAYKYDLSLYDIYKICKSFNKSDFNDIYEAYDNKHLDIYIQEYLLEIHQKEYPRTYDNDIDFSKKRKILDDIEKYLQYRYHGILGNELISVKNQRPDYFNTLYAKAHKELSKIKSGTRKNMCSFLLAMLFSFKEYINAVSNALRKDQLETLSLLLSEAETIIHSLAAPPIDDSNFLISCFASFINSRTKDSFIYGNQGKWLGWINESKDEACLLISSPFYKDYVSYVRALKSYTVFYSKSEFIRKVLISNGLTENRMAGTKDRYNKERVFEGKRYSVLSINYSKLTKYLSDNTG